MSQSHSVLIGSLEIMFMIHSLIPTEILILTIFALQIPLCVLQILILMSTKNSIQIKYTFYSNKIAEKIGGDSTVTCSFIK